MVGFDFTAILFGEDYVHPSSRGVIVKDVLDERLAQLVKYDLDHDDKVGTGHLVGEVGFRLSQLDIESDDPAELYEKLGQTAAMLIAAMEVIAREQARE